MKRSIACAFLGITSAVAAPDPNYVRDLSELLAIPSVSASKAENDRAIDWMQAFLEKRGVWCAMESWPEDGRKILYAATKPGLKNPDYTIVTHLDVVDAPAEQFKPRLVGSRLYARGACDTKGLAYAAAKILERLNGQASVGCVFSSNEEVGGKTTGHMVELGYGVPGKMVFVFDGGYPTNQVVSACKGCAYYRITAYGKSGHASKPEICDNPFYKLARAALKIEAEYPFQRPGEWGNVAAVTIVRGGDSQNRIPESAEMTVNVRFVEEGGLEKERELLERLTGLKTELIRGTPAAVSNVDDPEFIRLTGFLSERRPAIPVKITRTTGANDSRYFPQFNKPMVGVGGVITHGAHSADEWVDLDTLGPQIDLMCDFLREEAAAPDVVRGSLAPYVERGEIAGVVSVLSDRDYNEKWDCLGWADAEAKAPMRPDTVFAVFSMTKTFTGCAIMIAVDRGILRMDDRVEKYLPEFRGVENKVTIRDCMCHVTGIVGGNADIIHTGLPLREQARKWATEGECKRKIGEAFAYGNNSIAAAAACLEVASGVPYERFLKENVLDPLGMKDTTFTPDEGQQRRMVKAYTTEGGPFRPAADRCSGQLKFPVGHKIYPMPSAGLYSTPADMVRFSQMLAHHGEWKGRRIVSRRTFDEIWAVKQTPSNISQPYTVGAWLYGDWFGHEGAMRTDQRANLKTGHSRVFFIQTENRAGKAFFDAKIGWHRACDRYQRMETPFSDELVKSHENDRR